ncbi:MAG: arginine N-succinyltransferase [Pseudomonadota bacterium]
MNEPTQKLDPAAESSPTPPRRGIGCLGVTLIVIATMVVTLIVGAVAVRYVLFADQFEPVTLDEQEQAVLDDKLTAIGVQTGEPAPAASGDDRFAPRAEEFDAEGRLKPERYAEADAPREVHFDERELNAIIARDPELARRLAIDLSQDLVSVKLLVPLPPDFPVMGGQTVRVTAGAEVRQTIDPNGERRLSVIVTGVSLWGMPLPNAWIGGLRGTDLVEQFGDDPGFWQALAEGIDEARVDEGELVVKLTE